MPEALFSLCGGRRKEVERFQHTYQIVLDYGVFKHPSFSQLTPSRRCSGATPKRFTFCLGTHRTSCFWNPRSYQGPPLSFHLITRFRIRHLNSTQLTIQDRTSKATNYNSTLFNDLRHTITNLTIAYIHLLSDFLIYNPAWRERAAVVNFAHIVISTSTGTRILPFSTAKCGRL